MRTGLLLIVFMGLVQFNLKPPCRPFVCPPPPKVLLCTPEKGCLRFMQGGAVMGSSAPAVSTANGIEAPLRDWLHGLISTSPLELVEGAD